MTQSPKPKKPRQKEKLSDKEQSESFKVAASKLDLEISSENFGELLTRILKISTKP